MPSYFPALEAIARSGRVGQPVFVRALVTGDPADAEAALARVLAGAVRLLDAAPRRLLVRGRPGSGNLHAVLSLWNGGSVLAAVAPGPANADAVLIGNRGAAYSDGLPLPALQWEAAGPAEEPDADPALLEAIRRACLDGRPFEFPEPGDE